MSKTIFLVYLLITGPTEIKKSLSVIFKKCNNDNLLLTFDHYLHKEQTILLVECCLQMPLLHLLKVVGFSCLWNVDIKSIPSFLQVLVPH